jgi:hypothetical protein
MMDRDRYYGIAALDRPRMLPRAGRIRLGEKVVSERGKEYPRELDYFNLVDAPLVAKIYGDKPREIDILFPVNDPRTILDLSYMAYGQTGWKCRGTGVIAYNREADDEIECAGEDCKMVAEGKCKRQARLTFICYLVPGLCVYDVVTSGWRSIENCLSMIETLNDLFGRIDGIPLKMYREPYSSEYTDDEGKHHQQVHHCVRLDVAATPLEVKRISLGMGETLAIEPAEDNTADDMVPRSVKKAEALEAGPDPHYIESLLGAIPSPLRELVADGFDITGCEADKRVELLERYIEQPDKLLGYLNALADSRIAGKPETPKTTTPGPAGKKEWSF